MKKTKIIVVVVALVAIALVAWFFTKSSGQQVSKLDVIDTVGNFYDQWLEAVKEPLSTDPSRADLANLPILSKTLGNRLTETLKQSDIAPDPVLCQTVIPEEISIRTVSENTDKAQVLVMSRDKKVTEQALISLIRYNDGWYIDDIQCSSGEFELEREFSFERKGYLLKDSIPAPYDSKNWHLIFEDGGEAGHVVPLFFDSESQCTGLDGGKSVCKQDQFTETAQVFVHGQMTERGVNVKQQEFVK